jgi:nicotinate-nucleotide pyrophosphorylase (carboxylating)
LATVPADTTTTASMAIREPGLIAGVEIALLVLDEVIGPDGYQVKQRVDDGTLLEAGAAALVVEAPTQGLLTAERTMLNLVCHLSGIATTTAAWVDAVAGTKAKIRDTRKTLPGLRALQKYAVRVGGGVTPDGPRRAALIKDNMWRGRFGDRLLQASRSASCRAATRWNSSTGTRRGVELVLLDSFPVADAIAAQRRDARAPRARTRVVRWAVARHRRRTVRAWTISPLGPSPTRYVWISGLNVTAHGWQSPRNADPFAKTPGQCLCPAIPTLANISGGIHRWEAGSHT